MIVGDIVSTDRWKTSPLKVKETTGYVGPVEQITRVLDDNSKK